MPDGMPLDQGTLQRIAQAQGVSLTPDNMNRIREFAGANPDVLERYSLGTAKPDMQGGRDIRGGSGPQDNAALLKLAIDNSIASTNAPQAPITQQPLAPPPTPTVARAPAPPKRGVAPNTEPPPGSLPAITPVGDNSHGPGWDWLTALAGVRTLRKPPVTPPELEAEYAGKIPREEFNPDNPNFLPRNENYPQLEAPRPRLTGPQEPAPTEGAATRQIDTTNTRGVQTKPQAGSPTVPPNPQPGDLQSQIENKNRMWSEIGGENAQQAAEQAAQQAALQEQMRVQRAQEETRLRLKAAGRAVGRR